MPKNYNEEYFDTYEAMTEEERDELTLIQKVKSNIKYFVGIDSIIEKITQLIDDSERVSFSSARNKKYISKTKPMFILKPELNKIDFDFEFTKTNEEDFFIDNRTNPKYENDINYIQDIIKEDVIQPYSKWLMTFLTDNDKFNAILKEAGLDKVTLNEETLKLIAFSSAVMFAVKVDLKNKKIFVEYAI